MKGENCLRGFRTLVQRLTCTVKQNVGYRKQHLDLIPKFKQLDSGKAVKMLDLHHLHLKEESFSSLLDYSIPEWSWRD